MNGFLALVTAAGGVYLLYLSTSVRWADFGPLCVRGLGCADAYALGLGVVALVLAAAIAWWLE